MCNCNQDFIIYARNDLSEENREEKRYVVYEVGDMSKLTWRGSFDNRDNAELFIKISKQEREFDK